MKKILKIFRQYLPWLLLLFGVECLSAVFLWLADVKAFQAMIGVMAVSGILIFGLIGFWLYRLEQKKEKAWFAFLENPDKKQEQKLLYLYDEAGKMRIHALAETLRQKEREYQDLKTKLIDHEEYVESWIHETKMPLSLLTLLMDNNKEELPAPVLRKLDHIRNRMQEYIWQMLFYARLKGGRKDYLFENICLKDCIEEILQDYEMLLEEKEFIVHLQIEDEFVYTDRRGFSFILRQVVSNAIKYSQNHPQLDFYYCRNEENACLTVKDNGKGVKACDFPYIFEKGFTGDSGRLREKATGMGLYLAKEMATDLNLKLTATSNWGNGFEMKIFF
ncbi:sensor histidine kinase [Clostridiales bacterium COT073_COT-073]|nr:sensor histidine kinase [Clostridiales bacterium COT073_COT-073]